MNRQHIMLGALAVVALWGLWMLLGGDSPIVGRASRPTRGSAGGGALPEVVQLTDLERRSAEFNPSGGRNLFAYGEAPRPVVKSAPVKKPVRKPPPERRAAQNTVTTPEAKKQAEEQAARQVGPTPPAVNFKFVGYLGEQARLIGVFRVRTDDGEETVLAAEGEVLAENFRVHRIGYEEVEIGYTQEPFLNERKVLPMGGQS